MILGLSIQTFTVIHVIISLLAIASGILVLIGMLRSNRMPGWTTFFLLTTVLPSVTGFFSRYGDSRGAGYRHSLTGSAGTRAVRPLQQASLRRLAMDLRDDCCRLALSQCVGADCKSFQKISIFKPLAPSRGHQVSSCRDYRQLTAIRPGPSDWLITDVALARRLPAYRRRQGPLWQAVRAFCTCRG